MMKSEDINASFPSLRGLLINGAIATVGLGLIGEAGAQEAKGGTQTEKASNSDLTLQIYKGFSQNRLDLWDRL